MKKSLSILLILTLMMFQSCETPNGLSDNSLESRNMKDVHLISGQVWNDEDRNGIFSELEGSLHVSFVVKAIDAITKEVLDESKTHNGFYTLAVQDLDSIYVTISNPFLLEYYHFSLAHELLKDFDFSNKLTSSSDVFSTDAYLINRDTVLNLGLYKGASLGGKISQFNEFGSLSSNVIKPFENIKIILSQCELLSGAEVIKDSVFTNSEGRFIFDNLPTGTYSLSAIIPRIYKPYEDNKLLPTLEGLTDIRDYRIIDLDNAKFSIGGKHSLTISNIELNVALDIYPFEYPSKTYQFDLKAFKDSNMNGYWDENETEISNIGYKVQHIPSGVILLREDEFSDQKFMRFKMYPSFELKLISDIPKDYTITNISEDKPGVLKNMFEAECNCIDLIYDKLPEAFVIGIYKKNTDLPHSLMSGHNK